MIGGRAQVNRTLAGHAGRVLAGRAWPRWSASLLLVMVLHAAALLTLRRAVAPLGMAVPDAILIDLAPEPAATPQPPAPAPPGPTPPPDPSPIQPDPAPPDPAPPDPAPPEPAPPHRVLPDPLPSPTPAPLPIPDAAPAVPNAEVPLPPLSRPKPRPLRHPRRPTAQTATEPLMTAAPAVAPPETRAASAPTGQIQATWETALVAHLQRFRRFPPAAQRRGEQGVVLIRLTLDRGGTVLAMTMVRGCGYADLDDEAKAWIARAQRLPAVPPEIKAQRVEIVVPLRFTLR